MIGCNTKTVYGLFAVFIALIFERYGAWISSKAPFLVRPAAH